MKTQIVNARVKNKIDTQPNWATNNIVLLEGEIGLVKVGSTIKFKIGDGITKFNQLPFNAFDPTFFRGTAIPTTDPGTPTNPEVWIGGAGTYAKFGNVKITGTAGLLSWNGASWDVFNLTITTTDFYKKTNGGVVTGLATPEVQFTNFRGDSEIAGNAVLQSTGSYGGGVYEMMANDVIFNRIIVPFAGYNDSAINIRVYTSSVLSIHPADWTLLTEVNYPAGALNTTNPSVTLNFDAPVFISAGQYVYIFAYTTAGSNVKTAYFNSDSATAPKRHTFLFTQATTLTAAYSSDWSQTQLSGNFYSASFKLLYEPDQIKALDASKVTKPTTGILSGVTVPIAQFETAGGQSEMLGTSNASNLSANGFTYAQAITSDVVFNTLQAYISVRDTVNPVTVRVYKTTGYNVNFWNGTLLNETIFAAGSFPTDLTSVKNISLSSDCQAKAGDYVFVAVFSLSKINFTYNTVATGRRIFIWKQDTANPWTSNWLQSGAGYYQPGFKLLRLDGFGLDIATAVQSFLANTPNYIKTPTSGILPPGISVPSVQWINSRGITEVNGATGVYTAALGGGIYEQLTNDAIFNKISIPYYGNASATVSVRIYSSAVYTASPSAMTLLQTVNFATGAFNADTSILTDIYLDTPLKVSSGQFLYVMCYSSTGGLTLKYFTADATASPLRHVFLFTSASPDPWTSTKWDASYTTGGYYSTSFILSFTDVEVNKKITLLQKAVANIGLPTVNIAMPSRIYAIVGYPLTIYYDAVILAIDKGVIGLTNFNVVVDCNVGSGSLSFWKITPTNANVGTYSFTLQVYDSQKNLIGQKVIQLIVGSASPLANVKAIDFLGDSTTNPGITAATVRNNLIALGGATPVLYGTQGTDPNKTEGRSGWTTANFVSRGPGSDGKFYKFIVSGVTTINQFQTYTNNGSTFQVYEVNVTSGSGYINCTLSSGTNQPQASGVLTNTGTGGDAIINYSSFTVSDGNPLWNGSAVDIAYYRTTKLGMPASTKFDLVSMQLGINDIGQTPSSVLPDSSITAIINNFKTLCAAYIADNSACKIIIQLSPSCNNTGGGFPKTSQWPLYLINMFKLRQAIIAAFDNATYNANVEVGFAGAYMSRYYGYPSTTVPVSSRYSGITETVHTNSVHPRTEGYQELGDGIFHQIKYLLGS